MPYARQLADSGSAAGRVLSRFKLNMERPITVILIVNTAANTAGASVAGAQVRELFGEAALVWFSALFTLSVLLFSEILPKVAGVTYRRTVARTVSPPLNVAVKLLYPLVMLAQQAARIIPRGSGPVAPEEEVHHLAMLSAEEGSILPLEADLVRNVLKLNDVTARDIMTPRTVVFKLDASRTVMEVVEELDTCPHSRIQIYAPDDPENWTGQMMKEKILAHMARDEFDAFKLPLGFVHEVVPGHRLLNEFLKRRTHLLAVIDEDGGIQGVVTLEDVMESLIGAEIVDETDVIVDLQQAALRHGTRQLEKAVPPKPEV